MLKRFIYDEAGQDLIEYVLLGSFVAIAALAGATVLGTNLNSWYDTLASFVSTKGIAAVSSAS